MGAANKVFFLSLEIDSLELLSRLYIPVIQNGGLFVPSNEQLPELGTSLFLKLQLPDSKEAVASTAKVVWLNENPGQIHREIKRGYGVQLAAETGDDGIRASIEDLLMHAEEDGLPSLAL